MAHNENERILAETLMRAALLEARRNPKLPFGAVIAQNGRIVATGINHSHDAPHWHGEIDALDQCSRNFGGKALVPWAELTLVTTAEPCPMCMGAILWAGLPRVIFGTSIETLTRLGWWQIQIPSAAIVAQAPGRACEIQGGVLEKECDALFAQAIDLLGQRH